jgi:hypothetical protein
MDFEKKCDGYWEVNSKKFISKFEALKYATEINQSVKYIFFDKVWDSFDRTNLGKVKLNYLYRCRAQQLRDEYDYLILYFSGGADSYNVLRSFIDNNIKIDEVCVRWPMITIDKKLYNPNNIDTSAFNYLSEWDYAIKPVLDHLAQKHPEIKITIVDWSSSYTPEIYTEELIKKTGVWNDVEMPMLLSYSTSENYFLDKGKKVASVYGIDKPLIGIKDNKWYMAFADSSTGMGIPHYNDLNNVEYFYWTPSMPELAFEQAHVVCSFLEKNEHLIKFFFSESWKSWNSDKQSFIESRSAQNEIIKNLMYDNWTKVFQSDKPVSWDRADKHFWIFNRPEFLKHRDSFVDLNSLALLQIDERFRRIEFDGEQFQNKIRGKFRNHFTKWHFVKMRETF